MQDTKRTNLNPTDSKAAKSAVPDGKEACNKVAVTDGGVTAARGATMIAAGRANQLANRAINKSLEGDEQSAREDMREVAQLLEGIADPEVAFR